MNDRMGELLSGNPYINEPKNEVAESNNKMGELPLGNPFDNETEVDNQSNKPDKKSSGDFDFYAGIPIPEDKKRENDESIKLTGERKWIFNPFYQTGDGWELDSTYLSPSSVNEVTQSPQIVTDESRSILDDISAIEQPKYKETFLKGESDELYDLNNFLEKQKKYTDTIRPMVLEALGNSWGETVITMPEEDLVRDLMDNTIKLSSPNSRLEFIIDRDGKKKKLFIRNRDAYPGEIKQTQKGEIKKLTTEEVWKFCDENDGRYGLNVAHMREVIPKTEEEGKSFLGLVDDKDGILGVACILEKGSRSAHLHRLAVSPAWQGKGVGGRIIESLKKKYDVITLRPTPEGEVKGKAKDPAENLRIYYKRRGFIPGVDYTWNKQWLNLNDDTVAREFREINPESKIVFDNVKREGREVMDLFLKQVWLEMRDEISDEAREVLSRWIEVKKDMKRIEDRMRILKDDRLRRSGL